MPFSWLHNYWKKASPLSGLGYEQVLHARVPPRGPLPLPLHMHHQWVGAQSPLKFLAVKQPQSSRMMIYFQLQMGFVNTVINEERPQSCIPLAGPLKGKHTAFQH